MGGTLEMKRYIQSSTLIQTFNKDPYKAFAKFLNQAKGVDAFDEDDTTFHVYCECTADQLCKEFMTYIGNSDKVKLETMYEEDTDESYRAVVIKPTSDRWRKIIIEFLDMDPIYEYGDKVWVEIQDVF